MRILVDVCTHNLPMQETWKTWTSAMQYGTLKNDHFPWKNDYHINMEQLNLIIRIKPKIKSTVCTSTVTDTLPLQPSFSIFFIILIFTNVIFKEKNG